MSWWTDYPWRMVQTNFRETDMADIDARKFAQDLSDFGATLVTLNAGGIIASYESKLPYHTVSSFLTGSSLKEMIEACHEKGIRVIARMDFSKVPSAVYREHPDWAFITAEGKIIEQNGFVQICQNSEYQQEKVMEILKELLESHPFDGVYCNMSGFVATDYSGNIHGLCTCENCRRLFREAYNMEAPKGMDMRNPATMRYIGFQSAASGKLRKKMNSVIKAISPDIALDKIDYLRTESHTSIGEPIWVYSASSNSRQTSGAERSMPSDNASVDFMGFRYRESSVSPGVLELRQWQNLANSGGVSVYIMGRLDNHLDQSVFKGTKDVFSFHKEHEDVLKGLKSAAEVLLVSKSRIGRSDDESYGWIRALSASHIPFDEIRSASLSERVLENKKVLVLAEANDLNDAQIALIDAFAEKGGVVISSGSCGKRGDPSFLQCLGIEKIRERKKNCQSTAFIVREEDAPVFTLSASAPVIAPGDEIIFCDYKENITKFMHTRPEPLMGPPEVCYATLETDEPGVTVCDFGKGRGITIPWSCGTFYNKEGYTNTLNVMQDVLFSLCGLPRIGVKLHPSAELVLSRKEGKKVVSLINASGYFSNSFFEPVEMHDIVLCLPGSYGAAEALNGGNVRTEVSDGSTLITLDKLNHFEMIILEEK